MKLKGGASVLPLFFYVWRVAFRVAMIYFIWCCSPIFGIVVSYLKLKKRLVNRCFSTNTTNKPFVNFCGRWDLNPLKIA